MGKLGSSILTFLFSVPITAVGFMAIFGVPQVAPLNASPKDEIVIRDPYEPNPWGNPLGQDQNPGAGHLQDAPVHNGFSDQNTGSTAPGWGQSGGSQSGFNQQHSSSAEHAQPTRNPFDTQNSNQPSMQFGAPQPVPNQSGAIDNRHVINTQPPQGQPLNGQPEVGRRNPFDDSNLNRQNTVETSGQLLSWHQASARLTQLGIHKYHLERGGQEGSFLFVCLYSPADSPQVTHRFEAEGNDPLVATNQVITQIDDWLQKNYQQNNSLTGTRF